MDDSGYLYRGFPYENGRSWDGFGLSGTASLGTPSPPLLSLSAFQGVSTDTLKAPYHPVMWGFFVSAGKRAPK